ncbi:MAG: DMT family transporter [Pseudomonadota bacterium]
MDAPVTGNQIWRGTLYVVIAALLFAISPAIARNAASELNVLALIFWSNTWMFTFMVCWFACRRPSCGLRTKRLSVHFLRSVFTYSAIVAYLYAVVHIPFANAVILQSMNPLFVPILAFVVFRKISDRFVWMGVLISFIGVLLIVRPDDVGISMGEVSGLFAAFSGGAASMIIWSLGTTEPPERQTFYFSFFALLLASFSLPWVWQWPTMNQMVQIFLMSLSTLVGQFCYAKAFSIAPADKVNTWIFMSLVFAAIIGYAIWDEPILTATVIGAALVVAGAYLATREKNKKKV